MKIKDAREIGLLLEDQRKKLNDMILEAEEMKDAADAIAEQVYEGSPGGKPTDLQVAAHELLHHLDWMLSALQNSMIRNSQAHDVIDGNRALQKVRR